MEERQCPDCGAEMRETADLGWVCSQGEANLMRMIAWGFDQLFRALESPDAS